MLILLVLYHLRLNFVCSTLSVFVMPRWAISDMKPMKPGHFVCLFHQYLTCWTSRSESEDIDVHFTCESHNKIICLV